MEYPEALAGSNIVTADITLGVENMGRRTAVGMGGADHDHIIADQRSRLQGDVGRLKVKILVVIES